VTDRAALARYAAAATLVVGGVTLLRFVAFPLFLFVLAAMHAGIFLFAILRRRVVARRPAARPVFRGVYLSLSAFLPLLGWRIVAVLTETPEPEPLATIVSLAVTLAVGVAITALGVRFARILRAEA